MDERKLGRVLSRANGYWKLSRLATVHGRLQEGARWMAAYDAVVGTMESLGFIPHYNRSYNYETFDGWLDGWRTFEIEES